MDPGVKSKGTRFGVVVEEVSGCDSSPWPKVGKPSDDDVGRASTAEPFLSLDNIWENQCSMRLPSDACEEVLGVS